MTARLSLNIVCPSALDAVWESLRPMVERGLKHGEGDSVPSDDLKKSVAEGNSQLWVAREGQEIIVGMVVKMIESPQGAIVFVDMLAGRNLKDLYETGMKLLEKYRDLNGARKIRASCRPGLARILERKGWTRSAVIMEV